MIYIQDIRTQQSVYVPILVADLQGVSLTIKNTINRNEIQPFSELSAVQEGNYTKLSFKLNSGIEIGEYEYMMTKGDEVLARGLAQVGEYEHEQKEYKKTTVYEQY